MAVFKHWMAGHGWPGGFSMVDLWAFFRVGGACLIGYYVYHAYMALKHDPNGDGLVDAWQQIQVSVTGWNFKCHLWYEISHMCFKHLWSRKFEAEINDLWFDTFCFLLAWWTAASIFHKVLTVCVCVLSLVTVPLFVSRFLLVQNETWHILTL